MSTENTAPSHMSTKDSTYHTCLKIHNPPNVYKQTVPTTHVDMHTGRTFPFVYKQSLFSLCTFLLTHNPPCVPLQNVTKQNVTSNKASLIQNVTSQNVISQNVPSQNVTSRKTSQTLKYKCT